MRSLLSSKEAIFARASLWTEPSIASTHLNCTTEGATEGLCKPATFLPGAMVVMSGSFIAQKEELDGYHACRPISRSEAY